MATTRKKREPRKLETELQALFVNRVKDELEVRGWSLLTLSQRHGGPAYKTLYDAIERGAVPGLTLISKIAAGFGNVHPWELLRQPEQPARKRGEVVRLRTETPIFPAQERRPRKTAAHRNVRK